MQQNDFNLDYDGNNVSITIKSKVSMGCRIFLIGCMLILSGLVITAAILEMPAVTFGALIFLLVLLRYALWRLYGKECLTINKRMITYSHSCLYFKTQLVTRRIGKRLRVIPYELYGQSKPKMVSVIFEACNVNDIPENIYEFSLPVRAEQAEMISYTLSLLYLNKLSFDFSRMKICMN